MNPNEKSFALISLGCDKNTVDSEKILYLLKNAGFKLVNDVKEANIVIINTCAFILSAQKESIERILEVEQLKQGKCEKIIVCGCLVQRNGDEIRESIPSIDLLVNIDDYDKIVELVYSLYDVSEFNVCQLVSPARILSTPNHYAYVKIADGCDNFCTYCTIPKIRGRFRSRKIEDIVEECQALATNGVKELIIVAQDVTRYGIDIYNEYKLVDLLEQLVKIDGIVWVRLHYCYPELIDDKLIKFINDEPKMCKYLDIPLQHVSNNILKKMNRKSSYESICELITKIKNQPNKIAIRSSFIVGFPSETHNDFAQLKNFILTQQLDNVGVFEYSRENGTPAYSMPKQICNITKKLRRKKLYNLQKNIVKINNEQLVGKTLLCVCDEINDGSIIMRNQYNSPEVDCVVYCENFDGVEQGAFYEVEIIGFYEYDLLGKVIKRR